MAEPSISIALCTYNGAEYLQQQLDSLASQSIDPLELAVGDDGSTDETLDILKNFARHAPFPVHIHQNRTNLGFADNFLHTASRCKGDWIAFCDQDDVWLPHRLADCSEAIRNNSKDCVLILQSAYLVDEALQGSGRIFPRPPLWRRRIKAGGHYGTWGWSGFLQTVRADMLRKFPWNVRPRDSWPGFSVMPHDRWTCVLANALGTTVYLRRPAALYRRHCGVVTASYAPQSFGERIGKAKRTGSDHYRFLSEVAAESAQCLRNLASACANPEWTSRLMVSGEGFERLASFHKHRAELYERPRIAQRTGLYIRLWASGAYVGRPFSALGPRSAVKDAIRVLVGEGGSSGMGCGNPTPDNGP
jgi:glycosyltransferase involved in cell wall biosynthesis